MTKVNRSRLCRIGMSCVYVCMCSVCVYYALVRMLYYTHQKWSLEKLEKIKTCTRFLLNGFFRSSLFNKNGSYRIWFDLKKKGNSERSIIYFFRVQKHLEHTPITTGVHSTTCTLEETWDLRRGKKASTTTLFPLCWPYLFIHFFLLPSPPYVCSLALFIGFIWILSCFFSSFSRAFLPYFVKEPRTFCAIFEVIRK